MKKENFCLGVMKYTGTFLGEKWKNDFFVRDNYIFRMA